MKIISKWKPSNNDNEHSDEFVEWIESITKDFRARIDYDLFEEYKNQSNLFLKDKTKITDFYSKEEKERFRTNEILKIRENSLYFLEKYHQIQDGDVAGGVIDYKAQEAQRILSYLFDCGYNLIAGKCRQIWFTSTMGGLIVKRFAFFSSYFVLYMAEEEKKGISLFKQKMRYSFFNLPEWLVPRPSNVRDDLLAFAGDPKKGVKGLDSRLEVVTPKMTSTTGEAPNLVCMDEIGLNKEFSTMISEMLPALYKYNPKTDKQERTRQLICWGTGGEMNKGGAELEREWNAARDSWKRKKFDYPLIPIFFNAYARPGVDEKFYKEQRTIAYAKKGPESEKLRIKFHQHYPITEQDMFLQSVKTLIPYDEIIAHLERIYMLKDKQKPRYGFFQPRFNRNEKVDGQDVPFRIVGADWVPTSGPEDPLSTTVIFRPPEPNWVDRYYSGVDPISHETGNSLMCNGIWDKQENTAAAVMNWRTRNYNEVFLQSMLLTMYYGCEKSLIEINNGALYQSYLEGKQQDRILTTNLELPPFMQITSGPTVGINNRGLVSKYITQATQQMLDAYGKNIWIPEFFIQLKTFVEKVLPSGKTRYQAKDLKTWRDDVIFGITYSYICAGCYAHYKPQKTDAEYVKDPVRRYDYDENFTLRLGEFTDEGELIRWLDDIQSDALFGGV